MPRKVLAALLAVYLAGSALWVVRSGVAPTRGGLGLLNAACDPTRELWNDINARFAASYETETGTALSISQSHGGSGSQARAVIDGLNADVVTLALWTDTDAIRKAGLIDPGWESRLPNRSLPFTSTIVFVVRRGNPKQIRDWPDLVKPGVAIVTPNPKTSGNGKWSFLAAWGSVLYRGGTDEEARQFVDRLYRQVPILDPAARAANMTFAQKKIGDVHLTWENEAYLELDETRGELEIVYPSCSVLAEPHVAVVDANVRRKGTEAAALAYMKFLYTDQAQEIIARHHYRPTNPAIWKRVEPQFGSMPLFPVSRIAPSWDEIQQRFFAADGVFDQIYAGIKR